MRAIIEARNVGKQYRLGARGGYRSLRDSLSQLFGRRKPAESFWALDDVSFDIHPGEAVGIIGRNGAGKSTLLKILSRVTAPTTGEVRLRGRVAAMLEVGTGFHTELSGRENIFLNGAIMGMKRAEVRKVFDEIVAFADVEKFLDTPVKHYSSGMYVRLAFAVGAHLKPDILVVDEVLAVGDAEFQKKCLGKMDDVAAGGRTVLFVSHNLAAVTRLCNRAVLLKGGKIASDGSVDSVIADYVRGADGDSPTAVDYEAIGRLPGGEHVRLLGARVLAEGMRSAVVDIRKPVQIEIDYNVLRDRFPLHPIIRLFNEDGVCIFVASDSYAPENQRPRPPGRYRATVEIPGNMLAEGMFSVGIGMSTNAPLIVHFFERGALAFQVSDPGEGDSARGTFGGTFQGVMRPMLAWNTQPLQTEDKRAVNQ